MRFLSLNTDDLVNAHFIDDFQLTMKRVVLAEEHVGTVVCFAHLDRARDELKDEAGFKAYIIDSLATFRTPASP